MKLRVKGMSCGHCAKAIREAISAVCAEARVEVDLEAGTVTVEGTDDRAAIAKAIEEAGYEVQEEALGGASPA